MELKPNNYATYKRIKNTKKLPHYEEGNLPSVYAMITKNMQEDPNLANIAKDKIAGAIDRHDDPYVRPGFEFDEQSYKEYKGGQSSNGLNINGQQIAQTVQAIPSAIGNIAGAFKSRSKRELEQMAPDQEGMVGGISYVKKGQISYKNGKLPCFVGGRPSAAESALGGMASGASLGSAFGPWGTAIGAAAGGILGGIGSIFGRNKEKRRIDRINMENARFNLGNYNEAISNILQSENAEQYGDIRSNLNRYKAGKLPGFKGGFVSTANGVVKGVANAKTDGDELIIDTVTGSMYQNKPSTHTDSFNSYIRPQDMIIPGDKSKQLLKSAGFKNGRLPKFKEGVWPNVISSGLSSVGGLMQYLSATNDQPKQSNVYVSNPYAKRASGILSGLNVSAYPILPELYNQYTKGMSEIANSGGLSGGQRTLARLSAMNNLHTNTAKLLQSNQLQNNQYKQAYANYISGIGADEAKNRMYAKQFDLDYYSKAHAAKQQMQQQGIKNIIDGVQSYYANDFKRRQFNDIMGLYGQQLSNEQKRTAADIRNMQEMSKIAQQNNKAKALFVNPYGLLMPGMMQPYYYLNNKL